MAFKNSCEEIAKSKPLFLTIYATVIIGVLLSFVFVFTAVYSSNPSYPSLSLSSLPPGEDSVLQAPISSPSSNPSTYSASQFKSQGVFLKPIWESPSLTEKMPSLENFRLTKDLVEKRVKDNIIIVTFGNYAFMDFILTWVKHLTDLGLYNLLIGAMDTKLLEALYWKGIPVFDMGSHMSTVDVGWGSPTFHKMGREKVVLIDSILPFGYELLMCDTDMVWLKNPLPYFARFPEADVLTSTDQVVPTVVDDRLDVWQQVSGAFNIGIFHWRPTGSSKKLAKEWKELLLADEKIWDQNGFNDIVRRQLGPSVDDESGLVFAYDGNLKLGLLPASIFCSGHTYFVQAMPQQFKLEPYAVHTTFQYAGTVGKRHRLREAMVFYDPPEYYNSPGGFLSFKPSIPKSLLLDGGHNVESHFTVVNYQIKQIRTALAIAFLLKRTLVMPPIWCRLDRLWFGHPGILEGTVTRQPFICPLDHVFEVNVMLKDMSEQEFGPNIDIKEYSFLDNPSLPKQVKESWLDVHLCQVGSKDCLLSNSSSTSGVVRLPRHSSEETFEKLASSFKDVKVINFLSIHDAFLGFADKARERKFRNRVKRYVGIWCCVMDHTPGHIYYDMYWDEKPGWKPVPPQKPEDDHPPF
ncbi:arabinosyltransferase XEG113-like isoform X3 [Silene latifolia]|uniref:arabinosyltransferase XEG113-like isoform X3 n=1 Tax=Silene latifolia TaxID=37657 RepID=UPI003D774CAC